MRGCIVIIREGGNYIHLTTTKKIFIHVPHACLFTHRLASFLAHDSLYSRDTVEIKGEIS